MKIRPLRIRGGSGLGDAIYIRPIAEYFVRNGKMVIVCSDFPSVFVGSGVTGVIPFDRFNIDVLAHYTAGKRDQTTNQWQDVCRSAGVSVPLEFEWNVQNRELIDSIRAAAAGRPVVLVHGGRTPMGRTDGFGMELLPKREAFNAVLGELKNCFTVRIGKCQDLYSLSTDMNLNGATTVLDLLDLGVSCDAIVGQCSFVIPLAEVFNKPLLCIWAAHGMQYNMHPYIKQITPKKVLSKPTSRYVVDDWNVGNIAAAAQMFRAIEAAA